MGINEWNEINGKEKRMKIGQKKGSIVSFNNESKGYEDCFEFNVQLIQLIINEKEKF